MGKGGRDEILYYAILQTIRPQQLNQLPTASVSQPESTLVNPK